MLKGDLSIVSVYNIPYPNSFFKHCKSYNTFNKFKGLNNDVKG